jgi:hypothetical protein
VLSLLVVAVSQKVVDEDGAEWIFLVKSWPNGGETRRVYVMERVGKPFVTQPEDFNIFANFAQALCRKTSSRGACNFCVRLQHRTRAALPVCVGGEATFTLCECTWDGSFESFPGAASAPAWCMGP